VTKQAVFTEGFTVVGGDNGHRVARQSGPFQDIENLGKLGIRGRDVPPV
jgi:hypothetical protein